MLVGPLLLKDNLGLIPSLIEALTSEMEALGSQQSQHRRTHTHIAEWEENDCIPLPNQSIHLQSKCKSMGFKCLASGRMWQLSVLSGGTCNVCTGGSQAEVKRLESTDKRTVNTSPAAAAARATGEWWGIMWNRKEARCRVSGAARRSGDSKQHFSCCRFLSLARKQR